MIHDFRLYDLFVLSFVQLVVATVLVLSPARNFELRFRWRGSRVTEVILDTLGAAAVAAVSCFLAALFWGLPLESLATAAYLLVVVSFVVIVVRHDCSVIGKVFYASYAAAGFTFLGYAAVVAANGTRSIAETLTASLLIVLDLAAFLVWNSNVNYVSDVMCRTRRSRPLPEADPTYLPMVSIHIPAYNEPPELLIATIKAVEEIDYPNFEIVVIDNNTKDPAIYGPVEEYCRGRERIKFVHVAPWPGYKAGACNLALRRYTDPRAEIIGMIDADDIVKPYYLRETVGYFFDPRYRLRPDLRRQPRLRRQQLLPRPASTRTRASTWRTCRRGTNATPCRSSARWASSAAVRSRRSAAGTSGASARTPRPRCECSKPAGRACTSRDASAGASCRRASPG